jgi:hypothetical protein
MPRSSTLGLLFVVGCVLFVVFAFTVVGLVGEAVIVLSLVALVGRALFVVARRVRH